MSEKQQKQPAERWPETVDAMIVECPNCGCNTEMDSDIWNRTDNACIFQVCKHCVTGYVAERLFIVHRYPGEAPSFSFGMMTWRVDIKGLTKLVGELIARKRKGERVRCPSDDEFRALALTDVE
jgi:hypothetical protein